MSLLFLSAMQINVLGWIVTVGFGLSTIALNVLIVYCFYKLYCIIKKF